MNRSAAAAIAMAGLIAGAMDITAAILFYGPRVPMRILQSVATGLLGRAAFEGGAATAALGLGLHFFIATSAAAVYCLASRRLALLREQPLLAGPPYGIAVYLFMNRVVIPLSAARPQPLTLKMAAIHVFCVGLPIALAVRRWGPAPAPSKDVSAAPAA
jgi:uncharacterized membrane protein YagU involved in acid resistance